MLREEGGDNGNSSHGDCYPAFTLDYYCDIILSFRRSVGIISMFFCIFIIVLIILFKKYKFLSQRLILYLSVSAFFQAFGYVMGDYHISHRALDGQLLGFCRFQAWWTLFFDWVSFLWVCCITFNVFWNAILLKRTEKFEKIYFIVDIGVAIIISLLPFIGDSYGPAGLWCWISSVRDGQSYSTGIILQFVLFYGPFWFLCIVLLVVLIITFCILRRRVRQFQGRYDHVTDIQRKMWHEEIKPLMVFPFIYLFILIFPSMNRIRYAAGYDDPTSGANVFFWFMHAVTLTLHGTLYAVVFACDRQTMARMKWKNFKAAIMSRCAKKSAIKEYEVGKVGDEEFLRTTTFEDLSMSKNCPSVQTVDYQRYE